MRNFLVVLIVSILILFSALLKFDSISSIFPGWNSVASDNRYYTILFLWNIIIPTILYLGTRKFVNLYLFLLYFFIVNLLFIISETLVYDGITPGLAEQNFQDYMTIERILIYGGFSIHLLFYIFFFFKLKEKTNKDYSFGSINKN